VKVALIEVGLAEIPVAVLGDEILPRAEKVNEGSEKLYRFAQRGELFSIYVERGPRTIRG
jgi:hypothetical protein